MKKISAILLTALFLFNLFGYRILFYYQQQLSDVRLEASLDKQDYNNADLITIIVPLSLPYVNNQQNFDRVDGEITVNGKILKYVKRKISDGKLVLLCLPDSDKMRIKLEKDDFFKYSNDLVQHNQSKKPGDSKSGVLKNFLSEYNINESEHNFAFYNMLSSHRINKAPYSLPASHYTLPEQPPEIIS